MIKIINILYLKLILINLLFLLIIVYGKLIKYCSYSYLQNKKKLNLIM